MGGRVVEGTGLEKRHAASFWCLSFRYSTRHSLVFQALVMSAAETRAHDAVAIWVATLVSSHSAGRRLQVLASGAYNRNWRPSLGRLATCLPWPGHFGRGFSCGPLP
jgi:hypothetical protein